MVAVLITKQGLSANRQTIRTRIRRITCRNHVVYQQHSLLTFKKMMSFNFFNQHRSITSVATIQLETTEINPLPETSRTILLLDSFSRPLARRVILIVSNASTAEIDAGKHVAIVPTHVKARIGSFQIQHVAMKVVQVSDGISSPVCTSGPCLRESITRRLGWIFKSVGIITRPRSRCTPVMTHLLDVSCRIVSVSLRVSPQGIGIRNGKTHLGRIAFEMCGRSG